MLKNTRTGDKFLDQAVVLDGIERLGIDQVRSMVDLFARSGEEFLRVLTRHTASREIKAVADVTHKMRGAASNFGLQQSCKLLAKIELVGNDEDPHVLDGSAELRELFERSPVELQDVLQRHGKASSASVAMGH